MSRRRDPHQPRAIPPPRYRATHEADERILDMIRQQAHKEAEEDGFVTSMRHQDSTGEIERFCVYAWGPSAAILAHNLGMKPGPAAEEQTGPLGMQALDIEPADVPGRRQLAPGRLALPPPADDDDEKA